MRSLGLQLGRFFVVVVLIVGLATILCQQTEADDPHEDGWKCYLMGEIDCQDMNDQMCANFGNGAGCVYCDGSATFNAAFCHIHPDETAYCKWPEDPSTVNCGNMKEGYCYGTTCKDTKVLFEADGCDSIPIGCIGTGYDS